MSAIECYATASVATGWGDVFRVLATGLNGTPTDSLAQTLTEEQRWQVAAYVVSIRTKSRRS
jgi:hypothetical protein